MSNSKRRARRLYVVAATCTTLLAVAAPHAPAAPASDAQGYLDSTARCASPATAVMFGSTETSRVAICKSPDGQYEYRGVRVRDGARLIVPATSSGGGFVADNEGIEYLVTAKSLVVSSGSTVIREQSWVDFHGPGMSSTPTTTSTPPAPAGPPLPAEVGGGR